MSELEELDDEQLIARWRAVPGGSVRVFETLVERHQRKVLANCRYISGSATEAEDLAQEVFVKAYFGLGRFEGRSLFRTWLQRIKINHCLNANDKKRGRVFVDVDQPGMEERAGLATDARAERDLDARDERARIREVLDTLTETLRVPLVLRDADGLSYDEIARHLGIGLSAVKMRIKRAREEFRRVYSAEYGRPLGQGGEDDAQGDGV